MEPVEQAQSTSETIQTVKFEQIDRRSAWKSGITMPALFINNAREINSAQK